MNGFEPLRRRIIDYTDAGQWSEVYDGPIEGCEAEQLKAENDKLRELVADMWFWSYCGHIDSESQEKQMAHIDSVLKRMRELGVEV